MRCKAFSRTVLPLVVALALLPAAAAPAAAGPASKAPTAALWQWLADLAGLVHLTGEDGGWIDPNGATAGTGVDYGDDGSMMDPDGATAAAVDSGDDGGMMDPNGNR